VSLKLKVLIKLNMNSFCLNFLDEQSCWL